MDKVYLELNNGISRLFLLPFLIRKLCNDVTCAIERRTV